MRMLNENYRGAHVDKIDGVKIHLDNREWVHITPDPDHARLEVTAEAHSIERANEVAEQYVQELRGYLGEQG